MNILPENYPNFPEYDKQLWSQINIWFSQLGVNYGVSLAQFPDLEGFELLRNLKKGTVWQSLLIKNSGSVFNLLISEYGTENPQVSRFPDGRKDVAEHVYFWGYLKLRESFGRALIRPETLKDKIEEWFEPIEIDFAVNKAFSKKYFVVATNTADFKAKMENKPDFLEALNHFNNIYLEFTDNACLFMNFKAVSEKNLVNMINLGLQLDETLNN